MSLTNKATMEPDRAAKATQQTYGVFLVVSVAYVNIVYNEMAVYTEIYYHLGNLYLV